MAQERLITAAAGVPRGVEPNSSARGGVQRTHRSFVWRREEVAEKAMVDKIVRRAGGRCSCSTPRLHDSKKAIKPRTIKKGAALQTMRPR
jgi:hypothetical protein